MYVYFILELWSSAVPKIWFLNLFFPSFFPSFNRIDIPPYEQYDKLYDKLLTAIEETCGFAVEWATEAGRAQQQPEATWIGRDKPPPYKSIHSRRGSSTVASPRDAHTSRGTCGQAKGGWAREDQKMSPDSGFLFRPSSPPSCLFLHHWKGSLQLLITQTIY